MSIDALAAWLKDVSRRVERVLPGDRSAQRTVVAPVEIVGIEDHAHVSALYQNELSNTSFEIDATGWSTFTSAGVTGTASRSVAAAKHGSVSILVSVTDNDYTGYRLIEVYQNVTVNPCETYTLQAEKKLIDTNDSSGLFPIVRMQWYDANSSLISANSAADGVVDTAFEKLSITADAPTTASKVRASFGLRLYNNIGGNGNCYFDCLQLIEHDAPVDYRHTNIFPGDGRALVGEFMI